MAYGDWQGRLAHRKSGRDVAEPEHGVNVIDLDDDECAGMMERFIAENPALWNEDIGEV